MLLLGIEEVLRTPWITPTMLETGVVHSLDELYRNGEVVQISSLDMEYATISELDEVRELIGRHSELLEYTKTSGQTRVWGVTKAAGIRRVQSLPQYIGLKSYAVGDSQNDIEMLENVDVGIAMGDAPSEVLEIASWITSSVEENGLCRAMEHFGLA